MPAQVLKRERHAEVGLGTARAERGSKRAVSQCALEGAEPHVAQASVEACMAGLGPGAALIREGKALREACRSRFKGACFTVIKALLTVPCCGLTTATRSFDRGTGYICKGAVK